jgi:signal transduction histidine kinase
MTSPLRLCVRRSPAPDAEGAATLVTLRLPSDVSCIEEAVELVTRHCLAGHSATKTIRFRLQVVLSEALANAILRGNREDPDKRVHVRASVTARQLVMEVRDEGRGFVVERAVDNGLMGMRERALLVGGSLEVRSRPGAGTLVRLSLPLQAAA